MSLHGKTFKITHVLTNVDDREEYVKYMKKETHFGIPWKLKYGKRNNFLYMYMCCLKPKSTEKWMIEADTKLGFKTGSGHLVYSNPALEFGRNQKGYHQKAWGTTHLIHWDMLKKKLEKYGWFELEFEVTIKKTSGFEMEKLRDFNDKELSDVVLVVEDEKFYSSKMFLSFQSNYFKTLFFGNFKEANQEEVKLEKIDSKSFQSFLELLHGESSINDNNIDAILQLADMYDAPTATRRCEEFLIKESKWTPTEKLELANMYSLETLKKQCEAEGNVVEEMSI